MEYQAGGGKRLADLVDQLTLARFCDSFRFYGNRQKIILIRDSLLPKRILSQRGVHSSDVFKIGPIVLTSHCFVC